MISGLAKPEQYPAIREVFRTQEHASPYMEKYVGEAQYVMRYEEDALARARKRYKPMTDHHYTTLWEGWGIGKNGYGGGTINHAWTGGMLTLLSQYAAGVAPVKPGYEHYHVRPQMGPLKHIKTVVPSVKGEIALELHNKAEAFSLDLVSPSGTTATIGIPKGEGVMRITANGKPVWEQGKAKKMVKGLRFEGETEHSFDFRVEAGTWKFIATSL